MTPRNKLQFNIFVYGYFLRLFLIGLPCFSLVLLSPSARGQQIQDVRGHYDRDIDRDSLHANDEYLKQFSSVGSGELILPSRTRNAPDNSSFTFQRKLEILLIELDFYQENSDRINEIHTLQKIGNIYLQEGLVEEAINILNQALEISKDFNDRQIIAEIFKDLGEIYVQEDRLIALDFLRQSLLIYRDELGDHPNEADTLQRIGEIHLRDEKFEDALDSLNQALIIYRELSDRNREAEILKNIGKIYFNLQETTQALSSFREAIEIYRVTNNREGEEDLIELIANIYESSFQKLREEVSDARGAGIRIFGLMITRRIDAIVERDFKPLVIEYENIIAGLTGIGETINEFEDLFLNERIDLGSLENILSDVREISSQLSGNQDLGYIFFDLGEAQLRLGNLEKAVHLFRRARDFYADYNSRNLTGFLSHSGSRTTANHSIQTSSESIPPIVENLEQLIVNLETSSDGYGQRGFSVEQEVISGLTALYTQGGLSIELDIPQECESPALSSTESVALCIASSDKDLIFSEISVDGVVGQNTAATLSSEQISSLPSSFEHTDKFNQGLAFNESGLNYGNTGQYFQALDAYEQAYDIFQEIQDPLNQGGAANNLGEIHRRINNYSGALDYFEIALKHFQDVPRNKAATFNNIGLVYQSLGQVDIALSFYQQSLHLRETANDIRGTGITLHNIGSVYDETESQDRALNYYQQALKIREREDVNDAVGLAQTLNNLGLIYSKQNKHDEALKTLNDALDIFEEFGDRPNIGNTLDSLGTAYKNQGDYDTALNYYNQALAILQDVGDRSGVGIVHTNMGDLYEQQGNPEKAVQEYEKAITESIEPIWSDLRGEDLQVSYADKHVDTYTKLIRLLWTQGRYEDAFNYTERARARIFLNQVASGPTDFLNSTATPDLAQEQSLRTDIEDLNNQILSLNRLPSSDSHTNLIAQLRDQLFTKQNDYESLLNRLQRNHLEEADLVSVSPATLSEIQSLLDEDTTLVSYFVMDDQTLAFIITHNDLKTITLEPGRQAIEDEIHMLYAYDFAALDNNHPARLQTLHEWLIEPLNLSSNTKVEIAPHNLLHYIPFAALTDGEEYLSDRHTLSQLPSASVKRFLQAKRKPQTNTLMALGNPTFDLIFAGREAETISKLYDTPVLTGSAATESAVRSSAHQSEILHLATHGDYNPISPLFSSLRLNPDDDHSDGRLYVHEIYGLDLSDKTNLVVLSACQSHVGQLSRGDEIVGLSRAFLYAGTPSVMASLWNIDDQSTSVLMESFYRHLQNGKTKAEALQLAQQETRANDEYAHPYYWAAFALTGDRN